MAEPTNKEMINTRKINTTIDTLGEGWDGQEEAVLYNLNRVRQAIYDTLPNDATDTDMDEAFKQAWDLWGSDDTLMSDISDEKIDEMVQRIV